MFTLVEFLAVLLAIGMIMSFVCPSVRPTVTLCTVAKEYILQAKMSEQVNRKYPLTRTVLQLSTTYSLTSILNTKQTTSRNDGTEVTRHHNEKAPKADFHLKLKISKYDRLSGLLVNARRTLSAQHCIAILLCSLSDCYYTAIFMG